MSFTIEFQPLGMRLVSEEPITLLDAARQAGIRLRADCGGEGICGKCLIQIVSAKEELTVSENDRQHLNPAQLMEGYRLACSLIADKGHSGIHSVRIAAGGAGSANGRRRGKLPAGSTHPPGSRSGAASQPA